MPSPRRPSMRVEVEELRSQLAEAQETLRAIRQGDVDAIVVGGPEGDRVYTLTGADQPYRLLVEEMNEGAGTFNADGVMLYANPRLAAMLGSPVEGVAGADVWDWLPPEAGRALRDLVRGRGPPSRHLETELRPRSGPPLPVRLAVSAFRALGEETSFGLVATDLSGPKAQEARLRLAARRLEEAQAAGRVGSWEVELATGEVTSSAELRQVLALGPGGPVRSDDLVLGFHPGDRTEAARAVADAMEGRAPGETELRLAGDGPPRWVLLRGKRLEGEQGSRVILTFVDITDRRMADEERARSVARLHEIERLRAVGEARRQMMFTLAHELNTPLTPILMQLDLLVARDPDGSLGHALELLRRNVERLAALVGDVLEVARLEAGRLRVEREPVDLAGLVHEAVEGMQPAAAKAGVTLTSACGIEPLPVEADPHRIQQVLANLLSNALKFTPAGGRVSVTSDARGTEAVVAVADTGVGIAAEHLDGLFQPFRQVDPESGTRRHLGTGLGLYISKGIVEQHGGRLWAESEGPGKGATFRFALPLRPLPNLQGVSALPGK